MLKNGSRIFVKTHPRILLLEIVRKGFVPFHPIGSVRNLQSILFQMDV